MQVCELIKSHYITQVAIFHDYLHPWKSYLVLNINIQCILFGYKLQDKQMIYIWHSFLVCFTKLLMIR